MAVTKRKLFAPLCPENTAKFRRISANTAPYFHPLQVRRSGITDCVNSISFFRPSTFNSRLFTKLSFQHSRTYLQEPALRRSGGIQSCPTITGVSSPRPLSSPLPLFSFRRWAPCRNRPSPRQAPPNQRHPHPRTAGCTSASSARTPRGRPSPPTSPPNFPQTFSPPPP